MRILLLCFLVLGTALAQSQPASRFYTRQQCEDADGEMKNLNNNVTVCVLKYEWVCGNRDICNDYDQNCVDLPDNRGEACISKGSFLTPDAGVTIIMQIIASGIFLPLAYIFVVVNIEMRKAIVLPAVIACFLLLNSFCLIFSYFFLNAYVTFIATIAALSLYTQRRPSLIIVGMFLCLFALFWVSFQSGLGNMQHHSRFAAGNSINDTYEKYCDAYYRGYWFSPNILKSYDENPQVKTWGFCNRYWLASVLFFMILQELYLVLMVGAGAIVLWTDVEPVQVVAVLPYNFNAPNVAVVAPVVPPPPAGPPVYV